MKEKFFKLKKSTKVVLSILVALVAAFLSIWTYQARRLSELTSLTEEYEKKIKNQEDIKASLEKEKEYMNTDMFYEDIARKHLNMIKPNEMIIVNEPSAYVSESNEDSNED